MKALDWMKLVGNLKSLNWYKYLLVASLAAVILSAAYFKGKHDCQLDFYKEAAVEAQHQAKGVVDEVNKRLPEVRKQDVKAQEARARIETYGERAYEAASQRKENSACDLSDAELDSLRKLTEATRR